MDNNEQIKDIEINEKNAKDSDSNSDNISQKSEKNSTHSIKISIEEPDCQCVLINNVPKDITVKELRKLIISSSEFSLKTDYFSFIEDDILLFDDDFIRCDNVNLIYLGENDDDEFFLVFLFFHLFTLFIYFTHPYPIEFSILLYLILITFFGIFLYIEKSLLIEQAKYIMKKISIGIKLLFLFFYSMLPFFNADNLDQ